MRGPEWKLVYILPRWFYPSGKGLAQLVSNSLSIWTITTVSPSTNTGVGKNKISGCISDLITGGVFELFFQNQKLFLITCGNMKLPWGLFPEETQERCLSLKFKPQLIDDKLLIKLCQHLYESFFFTWTSENPFVGDDFLGKQWTESCNFWSDFKDKDCLGQFVEAIFHKSDFTSAIYKKIMF